MTDSKARDKITVEDDQGNSKEYAIEALFDMEEESYALLKSEDDDIFLMRVIQDEKNEQYLVGIDVPEEAAAILDAYQVAVDAAPAE